MKIWKYAVLCLCCACGYAIAQEQQNSAEWHARHNPISPYNQNNQGSLAASQGRWEARWGAISRAKNGWVGTSAGMASKREAKKFALLNCQEKGGSECEIENTYSNQCIALATGKVAGATNEEESYFTATRAATAIEVATDEAIYACNERARECNIFYSECSLPELIQ